MSNYAVKYLTTSPQGFVENSITLNNIKQVQFQDNGAVTFERDGELIAYFKTVVSFLEV